MAFNITAGAGNAATINSGAADKTRSPTTAPSPTRPPANAAAGIAGFNANVGAAKSVNTPAQKPAAAAANATMPVGQQTAIAAGRQAMGAYADIMRTQEGRDNIAAALTGKAFAQATARQQQKMTQLFVAIAQGRINPQFTLAGEGTPEELEAAAGDGKTDMLAAGTKGAFAQTGGPAGTVLLNNSLDAAQMRQAAIHEMGEAIGAAARRMGIEVPEGEIGGRMELAAAGAAPTRAARPELYSSDGADLDKGMALVDGRLVEAQYKGLVKVITNSGRTTVKTFHTATGINATFTQKNFVTDNIAGETRQWKVFVYPKSGTYTDDKSPQIYNLRRVVNPDGKITWVVPPLISAKVPTGGSVTLREDIKTPKISTFRTVYRLDNNQVGAAPQPPRLNNGQLTTSAHPGGLQRMRGSITANEIWIYRGPAAGTGRWIKITDGGRGDTTRNRDGVIGYDVLKRPSEIFLVFRGPVRTGHSPVQVGDSRGGEGWVRDPNKRTPKDQNDWDSAFPFFPVVPPAFVPPAVGGAGGVGAGAVGAGTGTALPNGIRNGNAARGTKQKPKPEKPKPPKPDPVWTALAALGNSIYQPSGNKYQFRNPVLREAAEQLDTQIAKYVRDARKRVTNNGGVWRNDNNPEIVPATPTASQTGSNASRPGTPENVMANAVSQIGKNPKLIDTLGKTFKGLVTSGTTAAVVTGIGQALTKMGVPLLNGGRPYGFSLFGYGQGYTADTKAGKINGGMNGPFVIYSPPGTQTSPATIWISVYPPDQPSIPVGKKGSMGHAISYGFAVDPKPFGFGAAGNTGAGHNISIGDFLWLSRAGGSSSSKAAKTVDARINSLYDGVAGAKIKPGSSKLIMNPVTVGGSVSPGAGLNTASGAAWVGAAFGTNAVIGPASPAEQPNPFNKILAGIAPTVSSALWIAPAKTYFNFNWKKGVKPPPGPPPTTPEAPVFVPPTEVPPKDKNPTVVADPKVYANRPVKGLVVELSPALRAKYGLMDWVRAYDYKGRLISTHNPAKPAAKFSFKIKSGSAPDIVQVRTVKGTTMNFKLSGAGTTVFGINRSAAGQKVNFKSGGKHVGAFADSKLGWSRIAIGDKDRKINQPSAVFHVVPPSNARPGTLKLETFYSNPAGAAVAQRLADNDSRDIDYNPGVIKRNAAHNRPVKLVVTYISKKTGRQVRASINISHVGNAKAKVTSTGLSLKAANGPKVYFDHRLSHTIYLANMP